LSLPPGSLTIANHAQSGTDQTNARLDAVRTGLAAGAGAGAAVGLMLAFRRQHHQEIATILTDLDATERRITELYTKAVEQLGSDKAPVRLGGLYALERLAQGNPAQRATIVNVICAYLRMPFPLDAPCNSPTPVAAENSVEPGAETATATTATGDAWQQERQVRLTAQRILSDHLREPDTDQQPADLAQARFWPGIRLDLTGATLINFSLADGVVTDAQFDGATFNGITTFTRTVFDGAVGFTEATFNGDTWFDEAAFSGETQFGEATFNSGVRFRRATFNSTAWFAKTTLNGVASFHEATFNSGAMFAQATFRGSAGFDQAAFWGAAAFGEATFRGSAAFRGATFGGAATFGEATFNGDAQFGGAIFGGAAGFDKATFNGNACFVRTSFDGDAWFDKATFSRQAGFGEATFKGSAQFGQATFDSSVQFDKATFNGNAWFAETTFNVPDLVAFSGAVVRSADGKSAWPTGWLLRDNGESRFAVVRENEHDS
jgi:hypothetical protein